MRLSATCSILGLAAAGAALLLCGTSARAQVVTNGTFDANDEAFPNFPGYEGGNAPIAGFTSTGPGQSGINGGAACCTNFAPSVATDGAFAFIQGQGSLSQSVSGFTVGSSYRLTYQDAARVADDADTNTLTASIGGQMLTTTPVNTALNTRTLDFTANAGTLTLLFQTGTPPNDQSIVIDNVSIALVPEPSVLGLLALGGLGLLARRRRA